MTIKKVRRLVNPTRRAGTKKKLSDKQIKHFGTRAQKAGLKRRRTLARKSVKRAVKKTVRVINPANLITLGLLNPQRRTKKRGHTVAKKRRKVTARASNPTRRRKVRRTTSVATANPRRARRRSKNPTRIYVTRRSTRRVNGRKRNPEVFGMRGADAGKAILAGLVGVYATKTITPMVAQAVPQISGSPILTALISGVVAWGGGMLVGKWDKRAGEGFMFGGLMQAGSSLLNVIVPTNPLSLSGLGDFAPARFPVPQNPITAGRAMSQPQLSGVPQFV